MLLLPRSGRVTAGLVTVLALGCNAVSKKTETPKKDENQEISREEAQEHLERAQQVVQVLSMLSTPIDQEMSDRTDGSNAQPMQPIAQSLAMPRLAKMAVSPRKEIRNVFSLLGKLFSEVGVGRLEAISDAQKFSLEIESRQAPEVTDGKARVFLVVASDVPNPKRGAGDARISLKVVNKRGVEYYHFYHHNHKSGVEVDAKAIQLNFSELGNFYRAIAELNASVKGIEMSGSLYVAESVDRRQFTTEDLKWKNGKYKIEVRKCDVVADRRAKLKEITFHAQANSTATNAEIGSLKVVGENLGEKNEKISVKFGTEK